VLWVIQVIIADEKRKDKWNMGIFSNIFRGRDAPVTDRTAGILGRDKRMFPKQEKKTWRKIKL
jgi:hypothetical protein